MSRSQIALAVVALCVMASHAHAVSIVAASGPSNPGTFSVANNDLINQGQSTFSSLVLTSGTAQFGSAVAQLNNGAKWGPSGIGFTDGSFAPSNNAVVTVTFNTSVNTLGYDLSQIISLTADNGSNQTRAGQKYNLEYSVVGSAAFTPLASVLGTEPNNLDQNEVRVTITSGTAVPLATGVDQLRFTFQNVGGDESIFMEIDALGSPTTGSVPEPTSLALFMIGGAFAGLLRRTRRAISN